MELGNSSAVARFRATRSQFLEGLAPLEDAISIAFDRPIDTSNRLESVLFFLGSRCVDDFREILLLASNGFGWGATAQLRGMFERSVAATYIHENPESVNDFIDYEYVRRWKVLQAIEKNFGISPEDEPGKAFLKANYERVLQRFIVPSCKQCRTTRVNHTWNKLDVVSMAGQIKQRKLDALIVPAYYFPLGQAHSTFASMASRVRETRPGHFTVDPALAESEAERTLEHAHLLLLNMLILQHERFQLSELGRPIGAALIHFQSAWMPDSTLPIDNDEVR